MIFHHKIEISKLKKTIQKNTMFNSKKKSHTKKSQHLPDGLLVNPHTGEITGTPTGSLARYQFVIEVTAGSGTSQGVVYITIQCADGDENCVPVEIKPPETTWSEV